MPDSLSLTDAALRVFPRVFMFDGGRYVIATLAMSAILLLIHRTAWRARIIQQRTATRADYRREILTSARTVLVYALVATPALWLRSNGYAAGRYEGSPSAGELALYVAALLIAHDTWFYWTHRAMHTRALFKRFHRTHHRSLTPTPFAAYAFDWPEAIVQALFVAIWICLIPTPWLALFIFLCIMIVRNVMGMRAPKFIRAEWRITGSGAISTPRRITTSTIAGASAIITGFISPGGTG